MDPGTYSYGGLLMGAGTPYRVTRVEGLLDDPPLRTSDSPRLLDHGLLPGADFAEGRTFSLVVTVTAPDQSTLGARLDALKATHPLGGPEQPFTFRSPTVAGGGDRRLLARRRRLTPTGDRSNTVETVAVQYVATDPRIYDAVEQLLIAGPHVVTSGEIMPRTFDLVFGAIVLSSGEIRVHNIGTVDAPWVLTIHGPVLNPIVLNVASGQFLAFDITMSDVQTLTVNTATRTVLRDGTVNRYSTLTADSSWWHFPPGVTDLRFTEDTPDSPGQVTVRWRSAWG